MEAYYELPSDGRDTVGGLSSAVWTGEAWPSADKTLLGTGRRKPPTFPLSVLGSRWAEWCERRAEGASAPVDYVAVALLCSAGAVLGNVRWPMAGAAWSEPPILWCGLAGSPSMGKSPAMDAVFSLIQRIEDEMAGGHDDSLRAWEAKREGADAVREEWKARVKAAAKSGDPIPPMPLDAEAPQAPVRPRIRVGDATVEKLGMLAAALPRGLLMVRDELAGWIGAFDRYGGGGGSDRAFALEMWGGRAFTVDRVGRPEPLHVRHLTVGVLGGIQPDKLNLITAGADDGLAARFLWCWPDAVPDFRLARHVADDREAQEAFSRLQGLAMGSDSYGNPEPKRLRLAADAEDTLEEFARDVAKRAHETSGIHAGALGKARGHCLRLACVLEHLWWAWERSALGDPEPDVITRGAVAAAAGLLDSYFLPMAEQVFGDAAIPSGERSAMLLARWLRRNSIQTFNARKLRREIGGPLREASAMDVACEALVDAGLIRPRRGRAEMASGRRPKDYDVHPAVWGAAQ